MDLQKLLAWVEPTIVPGHVAPGFDVDAARATMAAAGRSAGDHTKFLRRWNGCYALQGALHLLGARNDLPNQSLDEWNRPHGWRQSFGMLIEGVTFFADSGLGDQFGYRDGKVVRLRVLDARVERMASSFEEWLELVFVEPGRFLSMELFDAAVARLGPLPPGGHFAPPATHAPGDPIVARELEVMPCRDNLELRGAASMVVRGSRIPPGPAAR
ncbi:MAG: hypothetical protein JWM10_59 [Myxococcaceae bacterium]|nr:hypothetical protein [Myxococcaceae bacterium]